jgi:hypothetical protein
LRHIGRQVGASGRRATRSTTTTRRLQIELDGVVEQLRQATARAAALKVSEEAVVAVVAQTDKPHLKVGGIVFTVPHEKVRVDDAPHPRDLGEQPQLEEELPVLVAVHNVWRQDTQLLQPARAWGRKRHARVRAESHPCRVGARGQHV